MGRKNDTITTIDVIAAILSCYYTFLHRDIQSTMLSLSPSQKSIVEHFSTRLRGRKVRYDNVMNQNIKGAPEVNFFYPWNQFILGISFRDTETIWT